MPRKKPKPIQVMWAIRSHEGEIGNQLYSTRDDAEADMHCDSCSCCECECDDCHGERVIRVEYWED